MAEVSSFRPEWVSAPGDTVSRILQERQISREDFSQKIGWSVDQVEALLRGSAHITEETATILASTLGASAGFWITREFQYREGVARLRDEAKHAVEKGWLSEIPVQDMVKFGWLDAEKGETNHATACLRFFGVPSVEAWHATYDQALNVAAFRTSESFDAVPGSVAAWLRQGELESAKIKCEAWDKTKFSSALEEIKLLIRGKDPKFFLSKLTEMCAACGVAVAIVRPPKGCRASGATRFTLANRALMILSFRYLSDDQFWFTFFHEAGHLLLHDKKALFIDGVGMPSTTRQEQEANKFASNFLVPDEYREELLALSANKYDIVRFANKIKISPGIVVGQLQFHGKLRHNQMNGLKRRFRWKED
jgi:HTH-type transcriptional regulator/antitoxin HigA